MAITRAQIPEQVDVFENGGDASGTTTPSSVDPQTILDLYGAVQAAPVTAADVQAQAAQMAGLFPQPRKANFFDLASEVGAGLVAGAAAPGGFGVGLTAGLQSFNEMAQKRRAEADKIRQEVSMLAYQQVEAKRQQQLATSKDILEKQFELALKGAEGIFPDGTLEGAALNFILAAENNPAIKDSVEYKFAVEIASKPRRSLRTTEEGTIEVETPGLNIQGILGPQTPPAPSELNISGTKWTFVRRDANGDPIYTDGTKEQVIKQK
jgi:hypothetical protein|tara:strand:+ start:102 stop:899 length:798 start_codon:yes stop_codon:yes gene_type:complete